MERERKIKRAKEREKKRGVVFFPALSLALFFARAPLSERLEQANAYNAPTSIQADQAAKQLDVLIDKKSTNVKKMKCYKTWWWRRQARWQQWCRSQSSSDASSAEVANAKSVRATGYRKRLLDVVASECAGAVLEAAEKKRQSLGLKTVGRGPTVESRKKSCVMKTAKAREASAHAVQAVTLEPAELESRESDQEFETVENIQQAHDRFKINTRDSHRADKKKKEKRQKKQRANVTM